MRTQSKIQTHNFLKGFLMISFNPAHNLIETLKYPHARSHRTTFLGKMADTFFVFFGRYTAKESPEHHLGVFDIFTLGLHHLVNVSILSMTQSSSTPLTVFALVLYLIWNIPRFLIASALTLICSPFVFAAQKLSEMDADPIKDEIFPTILKMHNM